MSSTNTATHSSGKIRQKRFFRYSPKLLDRPIDHHIRNPLIVKKMGTPWKKWMKSPRTGIASILRWVNVCPYSTSIAASKRIVLRQSMGLLLPICGSLAVIGSRARGLFHLHSQQLQIVLFGRNWLKRQTITIFHPCRELDGSEQEGGIWQTVFLFFVDFTEAGVEVAAVDADVSILYSGAYLSAEKEIESAAVFSRWFHTGFEHVPVFPLAAIDARACYRHYLLQLTRIGIEQEDIVLVQWHFPNH